MRAALGAARARIARESLVESLVLGAAGGALGLLLAYLGLKASRCHRSEQPAAPSGDRRVSARARVHRGRLARVDAPVRLDHGTQVRTARRYAEEPCPAGCDHEPGAECDAQRVGRRAGGARARAHRERGAHDPNVSSSARRRPRIYGSRHHSNGADSDSGGPVSRPRASRALQHEMLDKIAAIPGVASAGFTRKPSAGKVCVEHHVDRRSKAKRRRRETRCRHAGTSTSRPATSKPWALESLRDATSRGATSKRAAA